MLDAEFELKGQGEQRYEEEIGVLFDSETPGVSDASRVVLDIEEIAPQFTERAVAGEQDGKEEDVILGPDLEATAEEEAFAVDPPVEFSFADEEAAYKEAA